ncbi:Lin1244/Lin1753 domain-containing protein [Pontibacter beigongshangensis]|uniref:Lin1244/Lin1753 domain-containing protein n=1 Tax=Pontibacter beigongshangensis TaxID=2574733 RepID=UPI00164FD2C7|nr:Lin1244/Lin1753 domain-containing protein [Pontibacter beigongshangensis]
MAQDTFYFSHDYNTRNNAKIKKLLLKHGMTGYGIFWGIIEDLYNNANAMPLDYECIAYDLRTDESTVKSILNDFDLFNLNGKTFGSKSVEKRLSQREEKSQKARESANKRWEKDANALPTHTDSNAIKERKGKDRKEKDIKIKELTEQAPEEDSKIIYPFEGKEFPAAWNDWKEYKWLQHKFKYKCIKSEMLALKSLCKQAGNMEHRAIQIIEFSIGSGYQGLFAPKTFSEPEFKQQEKRPSYMEMFGGRKENYAS